MELYGNRDNVIESVYKFDEVMRKLEAYAGSIETKSMYKLDSGIQVGNLVVEKFSFRNGNFMIIFLNVVDDGNEPVKVFLTIKERQEGLFNLSLGKKEKIIREITNLLT